MRTNKKTEIKKREYKDLEPEKTHLMLLFRCSLDVVHNELIVCGYTYGVYKSNIKFML